MKNTLLSILLITCLSSCSSDLELKSNNKTKVIGEVTSKSEQIVRDIVNVKLPPIGSYIFDSNLSSFHYFGEFLDDGVLDFYIIDSSSVMHLGRNTEKVVLYYKNGILIRTRVIFATDVLEELIESFAKDKKGIDRNKNIFVFKGKKRLIRYSRSDEYELNEYLLNEFVTYKAGS